MRIEYPLFATEKTKQIVDLYMDAENMPVSLGNGLSHTFDSYCLTMAFPPFSSTKIESCLMDFSSIFMGFSSALAATVK